LLPGYGIVEVYPIISGQVQFNWSDPMGTFWICSN